MSHITTPVGRMVQGHPMELRPVTDRAGQPKINKLGEPQMQAFVALAIAKGGEQHWNQTEWGQQIWALGQAGWPAGESKSPSFAWKITDGDSTVPNKKGKPPCNNEGFPGHWIINASNGYVPDCFANGNYNTQIMRKETFKTGDYARLVISVKPNGSTESPGMYVNLDGFELIQAGVAIQSSTSIDAQATFGATAAQLPQGAQIDPNMPVTGVVPPANTVTPPPPANTVTPPPPAPEFLEVNGQQYSVQQLRTSGWSEADINNVRK